MPSLVQSKYWCFTVNNPNDGDWTEEAVRVRCIDLKAITFQTERGENGTRHIQGGCRRDLVSTYLIMSASTGYIEFTKRKSLGGAKNGLGLLGAHLEHRRGSAQEAIDYCNKPDTRVDGPKLRLGDFTITAGVYLDVIDYWMYD